METVKFEQVVKRGCGLDVHKKTVVATIDGEVLNVRPASLERSRVL